MRPATSTTSPRSPLRSASPLTPREIAACTNVVNKYHKALVCGALDPETTLPQFNQELKDAGIDVIIEEKQAQLDAWLAEQQA